MIAAIVRTLVRLSVVALLIAGFLLIYARLVMEAGVAWRMVPLERWLA